MFRNDFVFRGKDEPQVFLLPLPTTLPAAKHFSSKFFFGLRDQNVREIVDVNTNRIFQVNFGKLLLPIPTDSPRVKLTDC